MCDRSPAPGATCASSRRAWAAATRRRRGHAVSQSTCGGQGGEPVGKRLRRRQIVERLVQSVDELGEPAREVDVAAVDVVERQREAEAAKLVLGHRGAEQNAGRAPPASVLRELSSLKPLPGAASSPHRTPDRATQRARRSRSSSRTGSGGAPAGEAARSSTSDGGDPCTGQLEHAASDGQSSGLVCRSARSASRTRSRWPGVRARRIVVESERRRDERRERLDVGAHDEDVARLKAWGRRASSADEHLAQDLDLTLPGRGRRAPGGCGRRATARSRRRARRPRAGRVGVAAGGVGRGSSAAIGRYSSRSACVRDASLVCISRASRPSERSSGFRATAAVAADDRRIATGSVGTLSPSRDRGPGRVRQPDMDVAARRQRAEDAELVGREAVGPNTDSRTGRSTSAGSVRTRSAAGSTRSAGLGDPRAADAGRHSSGCQRRSSGSGAPAPAASTPAAHSRTMSGRCDAYEAKSAASFCATARRRPERSTPSAAPWPRPRWRPRSCTRARRHRCRRRRGPPRGAGARTTGRRPGRRRRWPRRRPRPAGSARGTRRSRRRRRLARRGHRATTTAAARSTARRPWTGRPRRRV